MRKPASFAPAKHLVEVGDLVHVVTHPGGKTLKQGWWPRCEWTHKSYSWKKTNAEFPTCLACALAEPQAPEDA